MSAVLAANLVLRFILELVALGAFVAWGVRSGRGLTGVLLGVGIAVALAAAWGTFRVPGDPGDAPVAVRGAVRLAIEALVFGGATVALLAAGWQTGGIVFAAVVVAHYLVAYERVIDLLRTR
ncbi:MAG: YrdB family protein [Dehalococcoidia bacterium]